ncbi:hypothetical protein BH10ACT7_BH10ACT7_26650 [soil metagenome]
MFSHVGAGAASAVGVGVAVGVLEPLGVGDDEPVGVGVGIGAVPQAAVHSAPIASTAVKMSDVRRFPICSR